ncbi:MAG: glycosyltransferase [Candidatus Omnitrophota bacterium]
MPKILVIHASFGQGHKQAALAISSHLKAPCLDLLDFTFGFVKKIQSASYLWITNNFPSFWKLLFNISQYKITIHILDFFNLITYFPLIRYIKKTKPNIIITTHFFPPQLTAILKKRLQIMQISVVTDIKPHRLWANKKIDKFIVATNQTKKWLTELGINDQKIISGYVSIRKGFLEEKSRDILYTKFDLDASKQTILFVSSASGNFSFLEKALTNLNQRFNLLVIYGKNNKLKKFLEKTNFKNLKIFPFYQKIWELISLSSVIVTKPGGLTVFECGYKKKPFVFTHFIPGQEEDNMFFLKKLNIAEVASNWQSLVQSINKLAEKEKSLKGNYPLNFKDIRKPLDEIINNYAKNR